MESSGKSVIIGVDVGGTKIRAGAIDKNGVIICEPVSAETGGNDSSEVILGRITGTIDTVLCNAGIKSSDIIGIGMGVTGPLDNSTGSILECPQLPTMHFYPLKEKIVGKYNLPVIMDNDANALLLGESVWGAGRGYRTTLGFTLGTGLGCAIVVEGKLFSGANGMAGEIWPSPDREGTIEDIVSGRGVSSIYQKLTGRIKSAKEISLLARVGDNDAVMAWNTFGKSLAFALSWCINLIDPDIVILGGSIANSSDLFYESMNATLKPLICPVPAAKTKIVMAELEDNAGFIGSAALVLQGV
jgi:glucokinase